MTDGPEDIVLELTPEQQAIIRRLSGQKAQVLQLTLDSKESPEGIGRGLSFRWRLSQASGIPRQLWEFERMGETASGK